MNYMVKIIQYFAADSDEEAQELVQQQVREGMTGDCTLEIIREKTQEELADIEEDVPSFEQMLKNLNSGDMTKN
jgi:hypothetical protein